MKIIFLFLAVAGLCFSLHAQDTKQHTVQRGETFALIAKRYGLTEEEVRAANPNHSVCYTGLKLQIPVKVEPLSADGSAALTSTTPEDAKAKRIAERKSSLKAFWKGLGDFIVGVADGMNESGLLEETGSTGALIGSTADLVNSIRGEESHYGDVASVSRAESNTSSYENPSSTENADMNALQQRIASIDQRINEIGEEQVRLLREKESSHAKMISSAGTAVKMQTGSNLTRNFSASRARKQAEVRAQAQAPYRSQNNAVKRRIQQLHDEKASLLKERSRLSQQLADMQSMDTYADDSRSDSREERNQELKEKSKQASFEKNNRRSFQNQISTCESSLVDRRSDPERFLNGGETPSQFAREVKRLQRKIRELLKEYETKSGGEILPHDESLLRWNP
ncbi:LysM peptidoglycan-binding domain-containing protein [Phocaeicola plebeius]|uniref:LysM peptidoglycan-binding domain-containing protein n=1 Tax=Phocaeicola plebeius TaxID=310297 RepID=UPI0026EECCCF|nr:LysM peptidoglycan-binding domain-containing protein [Phocaeicola plebeius]